MERYYLIWNNIYNKDRGVMNMKSKRFIMGISILLITVTFNIGCSSKKGNNEEDINLSGRSLDEIEVKPIQVDGWGQNKIWCNWTEDTNESIFKPDRGEHWYAGAQMSYLHKPDPNKFDSTVTIKCFEKARGPLHNVDVVISGVGVHDSGKTNSYGDVSLSLRGCHLGVNEEIGEIIVEAKYGNDQKITSIMVLAGDEPPDQGTQ